MARMINMILIIFLLSLSTLSACGGSSDHDDEKAVWDETNWNESNWQ